MHCPNSISWHTAQNHGPPVPRRRWPRRTRAAACAAPAAPRARRGPAPVRAIFGGLFGAKQSEMGAGQSKQGVWRPAPASGAPEKVVSKSGFDVTPLTAEQRDKEAAGLSDFQKCAVARSVGMTALVERDVANV